VHIPCEKGPIKFGNFSFKNSLEFFEGALSLAQNEAVYTHSNNSRMKVLPQLTAENFYHITHSMWRAATLLAETRKEVVGKYVFSAGEYSFGFLNELNPARTENELGDEFILDDEFDI
jgi:hypothetical protein